VKLVDMRHEGGGIDVGMAMPATSPFPYGLRLTLNQEQLEALGHEELPPAGTMVRIEAVGCVTRASSEDPDADGDIDYLCVEIQIIEMGMEEEKASSGEDSDEDAGGRAGRMYGKG
jgi:hypothetical protein